MWLVGEILAKGKKVDWALQDLLPGYQVNTATTH